MALAPGTRLGIYEVVALLGAGGMGEVYRARDSRLNREVALKVLPEAFSNNPERMARFEREAKLLAALNHPNIAAIYGLEVSGTTLALIMELVEGPTLAERIASGAVAMEEALPIAKQVADAVDYAHEQNVIHRDLKPTNIKVTSEGTVKVLDFGLAKALSDEPTETDMGNSPTLSMAATMQGVILGTAAYMSPEQARGKKVDRRADVWAFGCVIYELLTGRKAFVGEDVSETLALVMTKEAALDALPTNTPSAIRRLLRRCLDRNLKRRLQNMGEARIVIEDVLSGAAPMEASAAQQRNGLFGNARIAWISAVVAVVVAALGWGAFAYFQPAPEEPEAVRFSLSPPERWSLLQVSGPGGASPAPLAISPDGRQLAFAAAGPDGKSFLWVRSLDTLTAQMLAGTEGAAQPFWSPDGRFLAFHAGEKLKKISVSGGPPITLCDAPAGMGGAWSPDGVILFASNQGGPISRVPASGGAPAAATMLGQGETAHARPSFLPDGRHFLYRTGAGMGASIYLASLDSSERKLLLKADATPVVYSAGHLLFLRERTLMAQPFDLRRLELTGEAFPIAEEIQTNGSNPNAVFSASENGTLVYLTGTGGGTSQLLWFDRSGKQVGALGEPATYNSVALSPDGRRASVSVLEGSNRDLWIFDVARGLRSRLTFDPAIEPDFIWSPDGSRLIFNSNRKGVLDLYQRAADGSGVDELLYEDTVGNKYPMSWSADGRFIIYAGAGNPGTGISGIDVFTLPLSGDRKPVPLIQGRFNEFGGPLSPDGRWAAYASNESGSTEIYVVPYPGPGGKRQVSTAGGVSPRWRRDGTEIFYLAPNRQLMAAAVNGKGAGFEVGAVKPLFQTRTPPVNSPYDVTADGQRFLINTLPEQQAGSAVPITVVVNWTAGLRK